MGKEQPTSNSFTFQERLEAAAAQEGKEKEVVWHVQAASGTTAAICSSAPPGIPGCVCRTRAMLRTHQPRIIEIKIVLFVVSCSAPAGIWQGFPPSFDDGKQ